jgi:hypothetical protein
VITPVALIYNLSLRVQEPGTVWTGLNAVTAAYTAFLIYQNYTVTGFIGGPNRTYLSAGGIVALITKFWDKKLFGIAFTKGRKLLAPFGRVYLDFTSVGFHIAFHPGAVDFMIFGNMVLLFTGLYTAPTPYAFFSVDNKSPFFSFPNFVPGSWLRCGFGRR